MACCHYDEGHDDGYEEGFEEGKKEAVLEVSALPDHAIDELREAVAAIRNGDPQHAIFSLQRAFAHDSAMVELIETEWRKK